MSLFSKLFGGGSAAKHEAAAETHKGFRIIAAPEKGAGGYRIGARIEKDVEGETRVHHLIRADRIQDAEEARVISIRKAKQVIDEQGDDIFT